MICVRLNGPGPAHRARRQYEKYGVGRATPKVTVAAVPPWANHTPPCPLLQVAEVPKLPALSKPIVTLPPEMTPLAPPASFTTEVLLAPEKKEEARWRMTRPEGTGDAGTAEGGGGDGGAGVRANT